MHRRKIASTGVTFARTFFPSFAEKFFRDTQNKRVAYEYSKFRFREKVKKGRPMSFIQFSSTENGARLPLDSQPSLSRTDVETTLYMEGMSGWGAVGEGDALFLRERDEVDWFAGRDRW